ncbi:dihydrofolate reductase [Haloplanus aerogenes]|uniref:dihydrofolate reductase n=1 Tax=Haloplanus aerogenes TaxID=660522 RepID=A0A3M0DA65_9EURY|nr:dihydrofolate reductase [Haloplanus aerogenes]AZH26049.1 dihydrofolate reductase [Haloplanus aerogenes]RMB18502.1 dihydrofolate reductase [Haloplanus aerogenes]
MTLIAVAAMTEDRIVADASGVPWDHPEDVRQYKRRVADAPVIVGRTTYEGMRPDPPGRRQIVLSRSAPTYPEATATVVDGVEAALAAVDEGETVYVIGGGQVYEAFLPHYDTMVLTVVEDEIEPTAEMRFFPAWDRSAWTLTRTDDSYDGFRIEFWERDESTAD